MTADPNKKTPRTFQCRDSLWHKFEQMARELECSTDYLINDAMKQYARQRGYTSSSLAQSSASPNPARQPSPGSHARPPTTRSLPPPGPRPAPLAPPPQRKASAPGLPATGRGVPPPAPLPSAARRPAGSAPLPPGAPPPAAPPMFKGPPLGPPGRSIPPPMPPRSRPMGPPPMPRQPALSPPGAPARTAGKLSIYYAGEQFAITKDRFIIGRGKQSSDLTIKDPNVSRQHAMVEFANGQYYVVDMGSTNGVEYNGQRIQRKIINEGDVFKVCDHELRFSYH